MILFVQVILVASLVAAVFAVVFAEAPRPVYGPPGYAPARGGGGGGGDEGFSVSFSLQINSN